MDVDLVFLADLEPEVPDQHVQQGRGNIVQTLVEGASQPRIEWNQVHPGMEWGQIRV